MSTQTPSNVPPIERWDRLLNDKVAVVTGGGAGIGRAIALLFARHGALVEIAEVDPKRASDVVEEIEAGGGRARACVVDVREAEAAERLCRSVLDAHGRVDVLVNNVGDYRPLVRFEESPPRPRVRAIVYLDLLRGVVLVAILLCCCSGVKLAVACFLHKPAQRGQECSAAKHPVSLLSCRCTDQPWLRGQHLHEDLLPIVDSDLFGRQWHRLL